MRKRYHHTSTFGAGPRIALDREQRAQWGAKLRFNRRPGRLSAGHLLVGLALLSLLGSDGRCDPSHKTLAALSTMKLTAVKEALARLRELGFLFWERRIERVGERVSQRSNAYALLIPCEAGFQPGVFLADSSCTSTFTVRAAKTVLNRVTRAAAAAEWAIEERKAFEGRDRQLMALRTMGVVI